MHDISATQRLIAEYHEKSFVKKLHIGCGDNVLGGWLNSDYNPSRADVIHMDATVAFPLESGTFDYIFSEHMIEHVTYQDGLNMLRESFRVLKSNGRIRISTPDLKFLVDIYREEKTDLQKEYIKWACDLFVNNNEHSDTFVINNFVRAWGHLFIYDEKTLRRSLEIAGFVDIVSFKLNESNDTDLRNLENENRLPGGFLELESFTLEARKPFVRN